MRVSAWLHHHRGTTFTSMCTAAVVFACPASCRAAPWVTHIDEHGVAAPPDWVRSPVDCQVQSFERIVVRRTTCDPLWQAGDDSGHL